MTTSDFPHLKAAIEDGMSIGLHIGAVVHVRRHGSVIADFAVGYAELSPQPAPLRTDQKLLWLSAGKPVTAIALGLLHDQHELRWHDRVTRFVPEFGQNGKQDITLHHLLTHTAALKSPLLDWPRMTREDVIAQICAAPMLDGRVPGERAGYDPQCNWYILSEIIERITDTPHQDFARKEILDPIGCTEASIGMEPDRWTELRERGDIAVLHDTVNSARGRVNVLESDAEQTDLPGPWAGDDARRASAFNPSGGVMGRAADLSKLYSFLLSEGCTDSGQTLLRPETVATMTSRQREGMNDKTFGGLVIDWGYGFLINSYKYGAPGLPYSYGRYASDATFGHGGMQSSAGFGDPVNGLAGGVIFNGLPGEPKHQKRILDAMSALYQDIGLAD